MGTVKELEQLETWKTGRELAGMVYKLTGVGAFANDFALRDQIRRASVSVMSNVAEGFDSRTGSLFIDFLGRAKASAAEVKSQLYIALDCSYIDEEQFAAAYDLCDKTARQIYSLTQYLERSRGDTRQRNPGN